MNVFFFQILTSNFISWSISAHSHIRNISSSINITSISIKDYELLKSYHQQYSVLYIQTTNIAYFDLVARYVEFHQPLCNRFRLKQEHIHIITLYPLFYELLIKLKPHLQEKIDRLNLDRRHLTVCPILEGEDRLNGKFIERIRRDNHRLRLKKR